MRHILPLSAVAVACLACGQAPDGLSANSAGTAGLSLANRGTTLSVATSEPTIECSEDGTSADVSLGYTVTSTGSADSADVTGTVDGATTTIGTIASGAQGWTIDGRIKTAAGEVSYTLANGEHTISICATQSGGNGRASKTGCSDTITVVVDCDDDDSEGEHCNQGVGNGAEGCDPGNSNNHNPSNDENGGTPGNPGRGQGKGL